jgi:hypothetical protein
MQNKIKSKFTAEDAEGRRGNLNWEKEQLFKKW